jgi:hypothetical protein
MQVTLEQVAVDENSSPEELRILVNKSLEILRLVASNPNSDTELLKELSSSNYFFIRKAVVSNPNTPSEILFKLGKEFPGELINNPVFSLLMLENPDLMAKIPIETGTSLYYYDGLPGELRERLDKYGNRWLRF